MRARARVRSAEAPRPADPGHRSPPPGAARFRKFCAPISRSFPGKPGAREGELSGSSAMGGRRCLEHEGRMPVRQPYPAVAPIDRLAAIWRLDMPPARSLSTSRSLRMGNLCPGMPRSLQKGSRQCRFADHPTVPMTPIHSLVVIARNGWSRSIGTPGRNQSESGVAISRCAQPADARPSRPAIARGGISLRSSD